jgi:phage gpG-like protein
MSDGMSMTVDSSQLDGLLERLMALTNRQVVLEKAATAGGQVIEGQAKVNVNQTFSEESTGNLAESISTRIVDSSDKRAVAGIGPSAVYGRIQELGGMVEAVNAKALHFIGRNGEDVFVNAVEIPARPYLGPALTQKKDEAVAAAGAVITDEIQRSA